MQPLHIRGRGLPDGEQVQWWVHGGVLSAEPISNADTVFDGGWIIPGLVDAHCHVGLGPGGPTTVEEAVDRMELVGHDFFLFIDARTDHPSVVYRRKGWDYGVISLLASAPPAAEELAS